MEEFIDATHIDVHQRNQRNDIERNDLFRGVHWVRSFDIVRLVRKNANANTGKKLRPNEDDLQSRKNAYGSKIYQCMGYKNKAFNALRGGTSNKASFPSSELGRRGDLIPHKNSYSVLLQHPLWSFAIRLFVCLQGNVLWKIVVNATPQFEQTRHRRSHATITRPVKWISDMALSSTTLKSRSRVYTKDNNGAKSHQKQEVSLSFYFFVARIQESTEYDSSKISQTKQLLTDTSLHEKYLDVENLLHGDKLCFPPLGKPF